jgi:hypothetical protein
MSTTTKEKPKRKSPSAAKHFQEYHQLLIDFCIKYNRVPTSREYYQKKRLGPWYQSHKHKIQQVGDEMYNKMMQGCSCNGAVEKLVMDDVKKQLKNRLEPTHRKRLLTFQDKIKLLFEYVEENKTHPTNHVVFKNFNLGIWFNDQKQKVKHTSTSTQVKSVKCKEKLINNSSRVYQALTQNAIIKEEIDRFLSKKNN